eukprot:CAMPEP_0185167972 /NCGR_PEP_ID=MMETSP1139-20130426/15158_1 /TAXON_ID=298111 /ORGANISM="Pavlova sp., Strain CCMP459" /LENGTH=103 /DNA_ID=CAMNT_0027733469 /DNA_START=338 /DNA_END=649 /DNA_ORIENTATION=-
MLPTDESEGVMLSACGTSERCGARGHACWRSLTRSSSADLSSPAGLSVDTGGHVCLPNMRGCTSSPRWRLLLGCPMRWGATFTVGAGSAKALANASGVSTASA